METAAWAAGCYKLMLQTGSASESTQAFYRACGFSGDQKRATLFVAPNDAYLTRRGASATDKARIVLSSYNASREERFSSVLSEVQSLIDAELVDVVNGTRWADLPFDWGGYR